MKSGRVVNFLLMMQIGRRVTAFFYPGNYYPPPDQTIFEEVSNKVREIKKLPPIQINRETSSGCEVLDFSEFDAALTRELDARFERVDHGVYRVAPGWLLKKGNLSRIGEAIGVDGVAETHHRPHDNVLRPAMREWLERVNKEHGYDMGLPQSYLVPLSDELPEYAKYLELEEEVDCYHGRENIDEINRMPLEARKALILYLASWVKDAGYLDPHFDNICLHKTEKIFFFGWSIPRPFILDLEPHGLIDEDSKDLAKSLIPSDYIAPEEFRKTLTISEAGRIGLISFRQKLDEVRFTHGEREITPLFAPDILTMVDRMIPPYEKQEKKGEFSFKAFLRRIVKRERAS